MKAEEARKIAEEYNLKILYPKYIQEIKERSEEGGFVLYKDYIPEYIQELLRKNNYEVELKLSGYIIRWNQPEH